MLPSLDKLGNKFRFSWRNMKDPTASPFLTKASGRGLSQYSSVSTDAFHQLIFQPFSYIYCSLRFLLVWSGFSILGPNLLFWVQALGCSEVLISSVGRWPQGKDSFHAGYLPSFPLHFWSCYSLLSCTVSKNIHPF